MPQPLPDPAADPDRTGESNDEAIAHAKLTADESAADWNDERMRAARPREIRLNPDGSRVSD